MLSGGAAARAHGTDASPAFIFPEMANPELVRDGWYPSFVDYLHLSFSTSMAFSPTDVSAIRPWAKLMMMAEESISLVVGILVVARAVNILKWALCPRTGGGEGWTASEPSGQHPPCAAAPARNSCGPTSPKKPSSPGSCTDCCRVDPVAVA